eukprot:m.375124 g.375124  ORF g.375124 m.375124 type:complete len:66 (+) comp20914_c0_seq2:755-952(+)
MLRTYHIADTALDTVDDYGRSRMSAASKAPNAVSAFPKKHVAHAMTMTIHPLLDHLEFAHGAYVV